MIDQQLMRFKFWPHLLSQLKLVSFWLWFFFCSKQNKGNVFEYHRDVRSVGVVTKVRRSTDPEWSIHHIVVVTQRWKKKPTVVKVSVVSDCFQLWQIFPFSVFDCFTPGDCHCSDDKGNLIGPQLEDTCFLSPRTTLTLNGYYVAFSDAAYIRRFPRSFEHRNI